MRRPERDYPLSYLAPSPILAPPSLSPAPPAPRAGVVAPIFLSGCNRGGTTLVTRLLAAHPQVVDIGAGQFDEGQYIWRRLYPDWSRHRWALPPWRWVLRRTGEGMDERRLKFLRDAFHAAFHAALHAARPSVGGVGRMLEKTPANAVRIPLIDRLYPDCRFVHVLRDGRDTSASLMARKVAWWFAPHQWVGAHTLALADLRRLPPQRVTVVRYEALIADPRTTLRDLCQGCGLAWGPGEAGAVGEASRTLIEPVEPRWQRLPRYQRRYILRVISPLQQQLGYPTEL